MHILCDYPKTCNYYAFWCKIFKNMQTKKLILESTYYETSRYLIRIIISQMYKNMHLHKNPGFLYHGLWL